MLDASSLLQALTAAAVTDFHDACLADPQWPVAQDAAQARLPQQGVAAEIWQWLLTNHHYNSALWAEEDLARRTQADAADIAANKRHIDRFNQARNDAMERIDDAVLRGTVDWPRAPEARLSSETVGAMIDRLSILALKIYHMGLQTERSDVAATHRESARAKWQQLQTQRADLARCLDRLLHEMAQGQAYFKIYRQFKMYNDPTLNPVLVAEQRAREQAVRA
jgi:hypothetical protein